MYKIIYGKTKTYIVSTNLCILTLFDFFIEYKVPPDIKKEARQYEYTRSIHPRRLLNDNGSCSDNCILAEFEDKVKAEEFFDKYIITYAVLNKLIGAKYD